MADIHAGNIGVPFSGGEGVESFLNRLFAALEAGMQGVAAEEQAYLEDVLSVPVERNFSGGVTQRSVAGEAPRKETGELQGNVETKVARTGDFVVTLAVGVSRPDTPDVPRLLEYGLGGVKGPRPMMRNYSMPHAKQSVLDMARKVAEDTR